GTIHFLSTDPAATLPADYTFTAGDKGKHTFAGVVLRTVGTHFVIAYDTADSSIAGFSPAITVLPATTAGFQIGSPARAGSGTAFDAPVVAVDPSGTTAVGYQGTAHFTPLDPEAGVVLPADYPFQPEAPPREPANAPRIAEAGGAIVSNGQALPVAWPLAWVPRGDAGGLGLVDPGAVFLVHLIAFTA